jgi:O-antigen ligase
MDSTLRRVLFLLLVLLALLSSQISAAWAAFGFLAVGWVALSARKGLARKLAAPLTALALLFALLVLASAAFSEDPSRSLKPLPELFLFLLPAIAMDLMDTSAKVRTVFFALAASGAALALVGFWQYARGGDDIHNRIRATLSHYMTFSGLMIVAGCLLLGFLLEERARRRWLGLFCVLPFGALLLSFTRNAYVGTLVAVFAYLALKRPRGLLLLVPTLVLVFLIAPAQIRTRIASTTDPADETNRDRVAMARAGLRMIADHPIFGLGPEMIKPYYVLYRDEDAPRWRVPHLHNNFLQIAAASGLFAAAAYLAILVLFFARVVFLLCRERDPERSALWAGAFLTVAALTVAGLFEYNFGDTEVLIPTLFMLAVPFSRAARPATDGRG